MDLSKPENLIGFSDPIQMPVSELLAGTYFFSIPSYQRGYRWESSVGPDDNEVRQVDDLLNDLTHFVVANANARENANYYLQPLMVKPWYDNQGRIIWDVLDGQQRLTTMLLVLKCLKEKLSLTDFPLYQIKYANRPDIDFNKIAYNLASPDYDYPLPNRNLDSFFVRKAKDRIEKWYEDTVNSRQKKEKLMEALFYEDNSRDQSSTPLLRIKFIWYNANPLLEETPNPLQMDLNNDIAIFNRLNGGKINLTNSELLKALFLLCIKVNTSHGLEYSFIDEETVVRKWDDMERKFQDNEFWNMLSPKNRLYENRLDFLFDFIRESDTQNLRKPKDSYRYYYNDMKSMLVSPNPALLERCWNDIKWHFDVLCKWNENTTLHNYVGYLILFGTSASKILLEIKRNSADPAVTTVKRLIRTLIRNIGAEEIKELNYDRDKDIIRKILVLFNVETCEKHHEKFSFEKYYGRKYDLEHVNSQKDNAINKPDERMDWIKNQALASLKDDVETMAEDDPNRNNLLNLIEEGNSLLNQGTAMSREMFNTYRDKVENYYAEGGAENEKDWIGNLTLLNSSINREYKNALFPQKLRTIKRSDQEGEYIPPCTRYLFLKYYSNIRGNAAAFTMMRWKDADQNDYYKAITETLKDFLS